jgi:hypothetical protein
MAGTDVPVLTLFWGTGCTTARQVKFGRLVQVARISRL